MPFELGVFLGARYFGQGDQAKKFSLIVDRERFRYQQFLSDIAGQDVQAHNDDPLVLIARVRNWLANATKRKTIPGAARVQARYRQFQAALPALCEEMALDPGDLLFNEYATVTSSWLRQSEALHA